ncbi:MAG TPA: TetR/AcrR family transcriptional regulator [Lachnospiraceae bacterium]|nr:TetR/AcrR family transcriptional regulator [Lachnospiraceae bacterium]
MNVNKSTDISRRIREAAFILFLEKGYEGTNQRETAEAAGYKASSIYFYYPSKKELFLSVLDEVWEMHMERIQNCLHSKNEFGDDIAKELFVNRINIIRDDYASYKFLLRFRLFPPVELVGEIREIYMNWEKKQKELYISEIEKWISHTGGGGKVSSEKIYQHFIKIQNYIINDIIVTGEFVSDQELEAHWNRFISLFFDELSE